MSFRLKTILGVGLIEALLLLILIFSSLNFLQESTEDQLVKRATTTATLFATTTKDGVLSSDLASLESFVEEVMSNADVEYARVMGTEGQLAAAGDPALLERPFQEDTSYPSVQDGIFDTYAEIREGGELYGRVEIGLSVATIQSTLRNARNHTLSIAIFELVLSALFSFLLGTYLTRRLRGMEQAAQKISQGKLGIQVVEAGSDELTRLARAFNTMSHNLQDAQQIVLQTQQELEATNRDLEATVAERTRNLAQKNEELEDTMELLALEQQKQLQQAFTAGIAENAVGVLHNIGNAITPAFVNVQFLQEQYRTDSTSKYLRKVHQALEQQLAHSSLDDFLRKNAKGRQLLPFFEQILSQQETTRQQIAEHLERMDAQLTYVSESIALQQKYAQTDSVSEAYEVSKVFGDVMAIYKAELEKNQIDLQIRMEENLPPVGGNKNKLVQVLLNLIKNSVESIQAQAMSTPQQIRKIDIQVSREPEGYVQFAIIDNGKGADQETLAKAFQFGFSTKNRTSGFGLHDFANFVRANKGEVYFSSPGIGEGATVHFTLPHAES